TTHMGGIADMVTHEASALVVPPGDVAATAAALTEITTEPALAGRLAARARIEVQRYLQSRVAADFDQIYASLVVGVGSEAAPAADRAEDEQCERDDGQDDENGPQHGVAPSGR